MRIPLLSLLVVSLSMSACRKADPAKIFEFAGNAANLKRELEKGISADEIKHICEAYEDTPLHHAAAGGNVQRRTF